jgi:hypothetical protein
MMVIQALSEAMPERVIATAGSPLWCMNVAGQRRDGKAFANMFFVNGGYGASSLRDGHQVLSWPSNVSSTPVEMIEQLSPLKVHYRRYRVGTGGAGRHRGGNGQEVLVERSARARRPPLRGLPGAKPERPANSSSTARRRTRNRSTWSSRAAWCSSARLRAAASARRKNATRRWSNAIVPTDTSPRTDGRAPTATMRRTRPASDPVTQSRAIARPAMRPCRNPT